MHIPLLWGKLSKEEFFSNQPTHGDKPLARHLKKRTQDATLFFNYKHFDSEYYKIQ